MLVRLTLSLALAGLAGISAALPAHWYDPDELLQQVPHWKTIADEYRPPEWAVKRLGELDEEGAIRLDIYYGPWCRDSSREVPKLLVLAQQAGLGVRLMPVDRRLRLIAHPEHPRDRATQDYPMQKTPTVVLYSKGAFVGEILEKLNPNTHEAVLGLLDAPDFEEGVPLP